MAIIITDECIACMECRDCCPMDAIIEGRDIYKIDERMCVECKACIPRCPVEAIVDTDAAPVVPEKKKGLFGKLFRK